MDPGDLEQPGEGAREPHPPLLPEVGVLALVPDRWGPLWQLRHQVASRLQRWFPTVWVDPAPPWREVARAPLRHLGRERHPFPNLRIHAPDLRLPLVHRPRLLGRALERARWRGGAALLRRAGCRKVVLYLWRPEFAAALDDVRHEFSCYHGDDEPSFEAVEHPVSEAERSVLERVDLAILHSPALMAKKGHINPHTLQVPNGVDYAAYAAPSPEPEDLHRVPRPRIGYTGWLKPQLDWELIETLVARHPQWSFVFVGACGHAELAPVLARLRARPNAHFLGATPTEALAAYPQHFDVCVMPYREDAYTRYIYPLKLHEYLASGSPVVGVPIFSLRDFAHVVELARGPDAWSEALGRALAPQRPQAREARRAVAREHDWNRLVGRIARAFAAGLGPDVEETLERRLEQRGSRPIDATVGPGARLGEGAA